jgi:hypothetical protein
VSPLRMVGTPCHLPCSALPCPAAGCRKTRPCRCVACAACVAPRKISAFTLSRLCLAISTAWPGAGEKSVCPPGNAHGTSPSLVARCTSIHPIALPRKFSEKTPPFQPHSLGSSLACASWPMAYYQIVPCHCCPLIGCLSDHGRSLNSASASSLPALFNARSTLNKPQIPRLCCKTTVDLTVPLAPRLNALLPHLCAPQAVMLTAHTPVSRHAKRSALRI